MASERKTIELQGKKYYLDSLDENSLNALSDINIINDEIKKLQLSISIANVAKNAIEKTIVDSLANFEEVPKG